MIEKTEDENASFQLGQKISLLPEASQLFYTECIIKEVDDIDSYHNEVLAVLNYELIVLALKALDKNELTIDSLKQLLPWVRDENRESWKVMLATAEVDEVFPWLDEVLESRKNLLVGSTKIDFESKFAGLFEKGRGRKLVTRTSLESDKLTLYASLLRKSDISYSADNSIKDLMEILEKHTKKQLPFYQERLAQRQDPEYKDSLRDILRMQVAINAIDEGLPLTHGKLKKVIQMFDKEVREHFEPHDFNIEPKILFDAFKQHLNGLINALNTLTIFYNKDINKLLIAFPNKDFRAKFLTQLSWQQFFSPNHPRFPDAFSPGLAARNSISIPGYKTVNGEIAFELPTAKMANQLRRLLRDQDIRLSEDNQNAICLPNELIDGNKSLLVQMPVDIWPSTIAAKNDAQRAYHLLSMAWSDTGSLFQVFPKDLIKYIAYFISHLRVSSPPLFPFKEITSEINELLGSESLPEDSKQFYQQMLDKNDASFQAQVSKVLRLEAINPCNEEIANQKGQLVIQSDLELSQIGKHKRERLAYKEQARNSIPFQQGNANPLLQKPIGRQKEPVNFFWAVGKGMFWACVGVLIGLVVFIAPIPVAPMLFIGWCAGAAFGLSAMKSGFSNIFGEGGVATSSMFWGGGLAVIGAIIGSIVGTFLLPGLGTLSGASVGALMGTGVGLGVALVSGPLIRLGTWLYDAYIAQPLQLPNEPTDINVTKQMKGLGVSTTCGVSEFVEVPQGEILFANKAEQDEVLNPTFSIILQG